jgi:uncharacterized protein YbcC (UPF0753/DUF2309 family)
MTSLSVDTKTASPRVDEPREPAPLRLAVVAAIDAACARIAPAWPLDRLIAVNPYWGFVDRPIEDAAAHLSALSGTRLTMARSWFRARLSAGEFAERHLLAALRDSAPSLSLEDVLAALDEPEPTASRYPTMVDWLDAHRDLSREFSFGDLVMRQLSQTCAAYADDAQASWSVPREAGLYAAFRALLVDDESPRLLVGQSGLGAAAKRLPEDPRALIGHALDAMKLAPSEYEDYFTALLLSVLGWASSFAFARWDARLGGSDDDAIVHLLAARLTWELLLHQRVADEPQRLGWRAARREWSTRPAAQREHARVDWVLQRALELAYQEQLLSALGRREHVPASAYPSAQLVFCIDVRSEVIRRCVERGRPQLHTLGFAGFFGLPVAYQPLGGVARAQLPGLLAPSLRLVDHGERHASAVSAASREAAVAGAAARLARGPVSTFSWVETLGLGAAVSLLRDTCALGDGGADPLRRHPHAHDLRPVLVGEDGLELPVERRAGLAAGILRGMSLTAGFARLVALFGHTATSDNNPLAAGLQCGACGGQSGEVNARALAALLNDPAVRAALVSEGIHVPESTHFLGGVHDTTTDELRLFDLTTLPSTHRPDLAQLQQELLAATQRAREERAKSLGLGDVPRESLGARLRRRSRDWSEVRPEWGLARNAALIVAPRERTRDLDLEGRAFLHEYRPEQDTGFAVLEQIMCAPMVVAHFINMQYYASTVDNLRYGSGNKVLHNVVGGTVGVFEGAGGDLRIGLPRQSLHDGDDWVHVPQRLSVFLEAPRAAIDAVVAKHALVRNLVDHEWLFVFAIEPGGGAIHQRTPRGWERSEHV